MRCAADALEMDDHTVYSYFPESYFPGKTFSGNDALLPPHAKFGFLCQFRT